MFTFAGSWRTAFWNFAGALTCLTEDVITLASFGWIESADFLDGLNSWIHRNWLEAMLKENDNAEC